MRTQAVNTLIAPLNEPEVSGLSLNDIELFAALTQAELVDIAQYRSSHKLSILHRIVISSEKIAENHAFYTNFKVLLPLLASSLTALDKEKATSRILRNDNLVFMNQIMRITKELNLLSIFSDVRMIATYIDSPQATKRIERCQKFGLSIPTAAMISSLSHRKSVEKPAAAAASAASSASSMFEQELQLTKQQYQHALESASLVQKELALVKIKFAATEREKVTAVNKLSTLTNTHTTVLTERATLLESRAKDTKQLTQLQTTATANAALLAQMTTQRDQLNVQLQQAQQQLSRVETERNAAKLQAATQLNAVIAERQRLADEVHHLKRTNKTLSTDYNAVFERATKLEAELNKGVAEVNSVQQVNKRLTSENSDLRRKYGTAQTRLAKVPEALGLFQLGLKELALANGDLPPLPEDDMQDEGQLPASSAAAARPHFSSPKSTPIMSPTPQRSAPASKSISAPVSPMQRAQANGGMFASHNKRKVAAAAADSNPTPRKAPHTADLSNVPHLDDAPTRP